MSPEAKADMPSKIGDYQILKPLGEGVLGKVFYAGDTTETRYAVKVCDGELLYQAPFTPLFEEEISKNVIRYLKAGYAKELKGPFFASFYFDARPASYERLITLPLEGVIGLFVQVAKGLEQIHHKGAFHGNFKPSNLLVRKEAGGSRFLPIITDPGLLYRFDAERFKGENLRRTVPYMAPEFIDAWVSKPKDLPLSAAMDIYSFGVTLCEVFSGMTPFVLNVDNTLEAIRKAKLKRRYRIILKNDPHSALDIARLNTIVSRAMASAPQDRYRSFTQLIDDLEKVVAKEAVQA